jgi:hypothetical protein
MLPIGSNRCLCSGCGRYFASVSGFDRHQTITDGVVECRDPGSIVNLKTGEHALILNDAGYWQGPEMTEIPVFTVTASAESTKEAA